MASKVRLASDPVTGAALQRTTGFADPIDHNLLAALTAGDAEFIRACMESGIVAASTARCTIDTTNKRITCPVTDAPVYASLHGLWVNMGAECEESGTADSGTTTSLIDLDLDAASANFWKHAWIVWLTGSNAGLARQVSSYDSTLSKLSWESVLPVAVSAGDTYVVTFFYVEDITLSQTNYIYMAIANETWTPQYGIARFYANTSGTPTDDNDVFIGTVAVSAGGVWSGVSYTSTDRKLYPIIGRYDDNVQSVTAHSAVPAGGTTAPFYATHDQMAYVAGLEVSLSDADFTFTILEHYEDDRVRMTITNGGGYAKPCTVTLTRKGCKLLTL